MGEQGPRMCTHPSISQQGYSKLISFYFSGQDKIPIHIANRQSSRQFID